MSNTNPSASGLDRAVECPASVVLPQVKNGPTTASERGNVAHKYIELVIEGRGGEAYTTCPGEYADWCGSFDVEGWLAGVSNRSTESTYAIDVVSGAARVLPKSKPEDYRKLCTENEFFGIADVIGEYNGVPVAIDWKTGQRLGDPKTKYQLKFFGLALHLITGAPTTEGWFGYIDEQGNCTYDKATFSVVDDDFEKTRSALVRMQRAAQTAREVIESGKTPDVRTGEHCQYCPAWSSCPAKAGLVTRTMPDLEWVTDRVSMMTPEQIGIAWVKYKELEAAMYRVGDVLKERARMEPIPLPNGQIVKPVPSSRTNVDAKKLVSLAKRLGATKRDIDGCVSTTSFDTLRQVGKKND